MNLDTFSTQELIQQLRILSREVDTRINNPEDVLTYTQDLVNVANEIQARVCDVLDI